MTIESGTIIESNGLNLTFNFTENRYASSFSTESNAIYFNTFHNQDNSNGLTYNLTERNASYLGTALPYMSTDTDNQKIITSALSGDVNVTLTAIADCTSVYAVSYQSNNSAYNSTDYTCTGGILTMTTVLVEPGTQNILTISTQYTDPTIGPVCQEIQSGLQEFGGLIVIIVLSIVAFIVITLLFNSDMNPWKVMLIGTIQLGVTVIIVVMTSIMVAAIC